NLRRYVDAKAVLVATLDLGAPAQFRATRETYWDPSPTPGARPLTVLSITNAAAARIFGRALGDLAIGASGAQLSGRAGFIDRPTEAPAYNVVGIVRGSDPKLRNTYVAVGSHHDHIGFSRPVDHDSIRAFNSVVRKRGADDRLRAPTADEAAR